MSSHFLWAGALSQWLIHDETGCPHSARHAIRLLDCLCDQEDIDAELRELCERASRRLAARLLPISSGQACKESGGKQNAPLLRSTVAGGKNARAGVHAGLLAVQPAPFL